MNDVLSILFSTCALDFSYPATPTDALVLQAVSPFCRFDDDDANAGNEWAGAWTHTNPTDGATGTYKFELSRTLTTQSTVTDAQMVPGETYEFGVAFWDPFQTEEGWTDMGKTVLWSCCVVMQPSKVCTGTHSRRLASSTAIL